MPADLNVLPYSEARSLIRDGDLLLFRRGHRLRDRLIAAFGRSPYIHAGMAGWWGDDLFLLDTIQWRGGRIVPLSSQVQRYPGRWDVFSFVPPQQVGATEYYRTESDMRLAALAGMRRVAGTPYGWGSLAMAGMVHLPVVRLCVEPLLLRENGGWPPMCSMAFSRCWRNGAADPVPELADRFTEPGDLARSSLFRYRCTLGDG